MNTDSNVFNEETLTGLFPPAISDAFFEALLGEAEDGAFDIRLAFIREASDDSLHFALELHERPGRCLACNLTYGLPEVFARHPIINLNGLAGKIAALSGRVDSPVQWRLGATQSISRRKHLIPLTISFA